jgi:hypothetical protein
MPTHNAVNRLAVDNRLGHQRPLLVLDPAPPSLKFAVDTQVSSDGAPCIWGGSQLGLRQVLISHGPDCCIFGGLNEVARAGRSTFSRAMALRTFPNS